MLNFASMPESSVAMELLLIGAAIWCWPMTNSLAAWDWRTSAGGVPQGTAPPGDREWNLFGAIPIGGRPRFSGPFGATVVRGYRRKMVPTLLSGAIVAMIGTVPIAVAAVLAVGTATVLIDGGRRRVDTGRMRVETTDAVRVLGRELRAGSSVATACDAAAGAAGPRALPLMTALGVAARVGAGAPSIDAQEKSTDGARTALGAALNLSRRYGIPLATLVDGAAEDLTRSAQAAGRQEAMLAGPRLSGYLLSALPLLGILLGVGMGANPLPVLFGPGVGAALLIVGVLLTCLGLLWSARIAQ